MIAGHFGFAAGVKSREPATPLWALMLATVWLDVVFAPLLANGIEYIEKVPGAAPYGGLVIHADYTHSLVGAALLSVILGIPIALWWGARSGIVVGLVSFSHWLLDLVVHRGDLPLLPGNIGHLPKLGFGLWRFPMAAATIELILVLAGAYLYWRAADKVAVAAGRGRRLAAANGVMVLAFGVLVLCLDVSGVAG
ncbi:MAG TPA: metal-dependent hydrolase [Phototrophicaceae bacterium]|nr:metal-dependent hydrolase [Phototrophicaceae bacterium]